ncbi:MAG TPA: hypothetical protein VNP90_04400, partial [Actinomycetota bacterium]|nr:hypothetical protein [Actinomycetota bacterium]
LLGGLAFALLGGDEPSRGGSVTSPSPSRSPSRSPSPSPSPSESPSPSAIVPPDPVDAAAAALISVVAEGVENETISSKAAADVQKRLDEALAKYSEGDTEKAIRMLDDLESKVDELVDRDEIAQSQEQKLDKAIRDLAEAMFLADPVEEDDEDD